MKDLRSTIKIPTLIDSTTPFFSWYKSVDTDGDTVSYDLSISPSGLWGSNQSILVQDIQASGVSCSYYLTEPVLENVIYEWRVRSFDGSEYSPWSSSLSFVYSTLNYRNYLLAYWKLDETNGVRYDSRNSYDLVPVGTDSGSYVTGKIGNALWAPDAPGSTYYADNVPTASGSIAISAWVYIAGYTVITTDDYLIYWGIPCIYTHDDGNGTTYFVFSLFNLGSLYATNVSTGWHHTVMIRDASGLDAWLDGEYVGHATKWDIPLQCGQFAIGTRNEYANYAHMVDEIGIWHDIEMSNLLSKQAWVNLLYNNGNGTTFDTIMATRELFNGCSVEEQVADYYLVQGAGTVDANGVYTRNGSQFEHTSDINVVWYLYKDGGTWCLGPDTVFYDCTSNSNIPPHDGWRYIWPFGDSPGPTIVEYSPFTDAYSQLGALVTIFSASGCALDSQVHISASGYSTTGAKATVTRIDNDDLPSLITVSLSASGNLGSSITVFDSAFSPLYSKLSVYKDGYGSLGSKTQVVKDGSSNLPASLRVAASASGDIKAKVAVYDDSSSELYATVNVIASGISGLLAILTISQDDTYDLSGKATVYKSGLNSLPATVFISGYDYISLGSTVAVFADGVKDLRSMISLGSTSLSSLYASILLSKPAFNNIAGFVTVCLENTEGLDAKVTVENSSSGNLSASVDVIVASGSSLGAKTTIEASGYRSLLAHVGVMKSAYTSLGGKVVCRDYSYDGLGSSLLVKVSSYQELKSSITIMAVGLNNLFATTRVEKVGHSTLRARLTNSLPSYLNLGGTLFVRGYDTHALSGKLLIPNRSQLYSSVLITRDTTIFLPATVRVEKVDDSTIYAKAFITERIELFMKGLPLGVFGTIYPEKIINVKTSDPKIDYTRNLSTGAERIGTLIPNEDSFKLSPHSSEAVK